MKDEISAASDFLTRLIGKNESLPTEKVSEFKENITNVLLEKFKNHWFPEKPSKGQAFRCIRINENIRRDPTLELVCKNIGIAYTDLMLPLELTLWIDPEDVTCRFGEHKGAYCMVANFRDGNKENYVDQINVEELEQKSLERAKQASFDLVNSRKRKSRSYMKNQYQNGSSNGNYNAVDYNNGLTTAASSFYPSPHGNFYGSGTKYGPSYGSSPSHSLHQTPSTPMYSYSLSPTNRNLSQSYRSSNFAGGSAGYGNKFSRGLQSAFNNAASLSLGPSYPTSNDRYHWINKSIVKA